MKKNDEAYQFAKYISDFLNDYAPSFLTNSQCTLKSYKDALVLYISFLEENGVLPDKFSRQHFEREFIERWVTWLKEKVVSHLIWKNSY